MNLKIATMEDFNEVKEMALEFLKESPYANYPKDITKVDNIIFSFLLDKELNNNKERVCLLAIPKGSNKPIGIIAGYTTEALFTNQKVATEVMWWVYPEHRGRSRASIELLQAFEHWASMVGSSYVQMASLASLDDSRGIVEKIYKKFGYKTTEINYIKEINN